MITELKALLPLLSQINTKSKEHILSNKDFDKLETIINELEKLQNQVDIELNKIKKLDRMNRLDYDFDKVPNSLDNFSLVIIHFMKIYQILFQCIQAIYTFDDIQCKLLEHYEDLLNDE